MRSIGPVLLLVLTSCASAAPESVPTALASGLSVPTSPAEPSENAAEPTAGPTSFPDPALADGVSGDEAVQIARDALVDEPWVVVGLTAGSLGELRPDWGDYEWGRALSADLRVWRVSLRSGELTAQAVIDAADGSVYTAIQGIAN
jgi:hypothetical protein